MRASGHVGLRRARQGQSARRTPSRSPRLTDLLWQAVKGFGRRVTFPREGDGEVVADGPTYTHALRLAGSEGTAGRRDDEAGAGGRRHPAQRLAATVRKGQDRIVGLAPTAPASACSGMSAPP